MNVIHRGIRLRDRRREGLRLLNRLQFRLSFGSFRQLTSVLVHQALTLSPDRRHRVGFWLNPWVKRLSWDQQGVSGGCLYVREDWHSGNTRPLLRWPGERDRLRVQHLRRFRNGVLDGWGRDNISDRRGLSLLSILRFSRLLRGLGLGFNVGVDFWIQGAWLGADRRSSCRLNGRRDIVVPTTVHPSHGPAERSARCHPFDGLLTDSFLPGFRRPDVLKCLLFE